jgi:hypothetical protein
MNIGELCTGRSHLECDATVDSKHKLNARSDKSVYQADTRNHSKR